MRKSGTAVLLALLLVLLSASAAAAFSYRVQWGDTLFSIAGRYGASVPAIIQANQLANPNLIYAGQTLEIPADSAVPLPPPSPQPTPPVATTTYVVQRGDTLSGIARRFGVTIAAVAQANHITNVHYIIAGQTLIIPAGAGPLPPPPPAPKPPTTSSSMALGGQSHNLTHRELMAGAGMTWVKFQHKWTPGDAPATLAGRIAEAHNSGFKVLLSITGADTYPGPGSIDFSRYAQFVGGVAALGPDAIEVWNEMNIDFEWPAGEINPAAYVNQMLSPSYQAIKAANPSVMAISGALAPTGFDNGHNAWADDRYLAGMRAAGAARFTDCIGVHHNAGATSPSVTTGHPAAYHHSWYFLPTLHLYADSFGGARPLCFTELGYLSADGYPGLPASFSWAGGTSVSEQAQWLGEAVRLAAASGKVRLLIVYNVDFTEYDLSGDPQAGYAILRPDGSCPACATLRAAVGR
ncbi:MAG: LysM peptidoglycan-binding domain-containing protein [Anaerolineae bacterium]